MDDYNSIAEELEKLAEDTDLTLDKVAAAAILYESGDSSNKTAPVESLLKIASSALTAAELGTKLGVDIGIKAFMKHLEV